MPEEEALEYMIYQITEGDITKRDTVLQLTYAECVRWLLLRRYDSYVQRELMKGD